MGVACIWHSLTKTGADLFFHEQYKNGIIFSLRGDSIFIGVIAYLKKQILYG